MRDLRGFTLVELLVVIAIIGVLASVLLLQFGAARGRARDARRISAAGQIQTAVEQYFEEFGFYPQNIDTAAIGKYFSSGVPPTDPLTPATLYGYKPQQATNATQYQVWTELEYKAAAAMAADIDANSTAWVPAGSGRGGANGATETCANTAITDTECVYDLGQR